MSDPENQIESITHQRTAYTVALVIGLNIGLIWFFVTNGVENIYRSIALFVGVEFIAIVAVIRLQVLNARAKGTPKESLAGEVFWNLLFGWFQK